MRKKSALISTILAAWIVSGTAAFGQSTDDNRLDDAWKAALEDQEGVLTPQQTAALNNIAYAAAVARVCQGFEIDHDKYAKAVNDIVVPGSEKRSDQENLERQSSILVSLGTAYGLFLAEGTAKKDDFCANAMELKADKQSVNLWE
jgi:hypothetical protein